MELKLCICEPDKVTEARIDELVLPASTGQIGILPDHAPLTTSLDIGVLRRRTDSVWSSMFLFGGFAEIENNRVTILTNEAVDGALIDRDRAQKDLDEANSLAEAATNPVDRLAAKVQGLEAQARLQASSDYKSGT